ncbi:hypothetical protein, partial [Marinobacter sp.]|uniref:hypothetical protein n=1 Tax=Marinobacter sp. TaxID=50741 RepID=UPI003A8DCFE1
QAKTDTQLARGVIQRQAIVIQLSQAWQQLGDTVDETRGIISALEILRRQAGGDLVVGNA